MKFYSRVKMEYRMAEKKYGDEKRIFQNYEP
jgi:hypothetical protein